ncbi:solute carrier family 43 member 3 [Plakobranchus ocellatus]|uniref:Solute carrier family 43 member 3 n=1 Tax=Plakobranchus ocellatus TaxID=259542 RepID=A0AAV4AQ05_9GAST|nr:solute carrier family 43 member 3 [Plakobranchus ocellatus]
MPHKCSKRLSALTWALFECMFFSSVVLGWTWLSIVFRSDGYFTESCNVTLLNVTSLGADALTRVDQRLTGLRAEGGYKRDSVMTKPCRPRREVAPYSETGRETSLRKNPTEEESGFPGRRLSVRGTTDSSVRNLTSTQSIIDKGSEEAESTFVLMQKQAWTSGQQVAVSSLNDMYRHPRLSPVSRMSSSEQEVGLASQARHRRDGQYHLSVSSADQSLSARVSRPRVVGYCVKQNEKIRLMFALVLILRDLLTFPMGAFYDKHGTTKTRLLTVLIFALGTLMMIFTSADVPWLVVPALALTGIAGSAVLLSNLQTANLFGRRRHVVVSLYVGAAYSNGIITLLMQLSHFDGVNLQTSFMFLTIGIVPLLVSTVAFLPKTRIPWPLPADYGKRRNKSLDEDMLRKQRAWQRRMSEEPDLDLAPHLFPDSSPLTEAPGGGRCRKPPPDFTPLAAQSLFVVSALWFGVQRLQEAVFDTRVVDLADMELAGLLDYETYYGVVQLLAVFVSPLAGLLLDRHMPRELGSTQATQQMRRLVPNILMTSSLGVAQVMIDMYSNPVAQAMAAVVNLFHKVFAHTTMCAFVMHVHFNHQHLGKYYGLTCAVSAVISACQFPIRIFLINQASSLMSAQILLLVLGVLSYGHAINAWDQCRRRLIRDQSDRSTERFQGSSSGGVGPLSVYIETDESNLPGNNANTSNGPPMGGKGELVAAPTSPSLECHAAAGNHGDGQRVVVIVGEDEEEGHSGKGQDADVKEVQERSADVPEDLDAPVTQAEAPVTKDATPEPEALPPQEVPLMSEEEERERAAGEEMEDEEDEVEDASPSAMLEFVKL